MIAEHTARAAHAQQKDSLCGPFHAARVLFEAGIGEWRGTAIDQDLVAQHAGTAVAPGPDVPPGATSLRDYRCPLPVAGPDRAGTSARGLASAIALLSAGVLECTPLHGSWRAQVVEQLLESTPRLGARLIANLRAGRLWHSRPPLQALLAELAAEPHAEAPGFEWDVGHFVELLTLVRGRAGALVVVRDSYPMLGWSAHHPQPPRTIAEALTRGDGREGGVLAVTASGRAGAVGELAGELGLEIGFWEN